MVFEIVAIVTPANGKETELEALLKELTSGVWKHKPDVERYLAYKVTGRQHTDGPAEFVVVERFKDEATFDAHIALDYFKDIGRRMAEQQLLAKPLNLMKVVSIGGFDSREGKAKL
jgi:quinol monooxygenase YgiN